MLHKDFIGFAFLFFVVMASRFPFLWAGYGVEEDPWLLALTAKNIAQSGAYEMSRAPGHPLQEIIYALMWDAGPFAYNLMSAVMSVIAVLFFALSLRQLGFRHYLYAAFAFAFTPVVFISSTYTMDYMWAMAFVMSGFYFLTSPPSPLLKERGVRGEVLAGILLGLSLGCRITSALMLIPFSILLFYGERNLKKILTLVTTTFVVALLVYFPVLKEYGLLFFTYSDQFPYPNFFKMMYKATIGVFGTVGVTTILFLLIKILLDKRNNREKVNSFPFGRIGWVCIIVIILYTLAYLRLPQKSAYLIPIIPFVILLFGTFLSTLSFRIFCVLLTLSSFFFSVNLTDSFRGAKYSPLAIRFSLAGQEIFIDLLTGPLFSDYTKRLNKMEFTRTVLERTEIERNKIVLLCGWWYNQLLVEQWERKKNPDVIFTFYLNENAMKKYISEGYRIYYLPEQDIYNDLYLKINITGSVAKPYF